MSPANPETQKKISTKVNRRRLFSNIKIALRSYEMITGDSLRLHVISTRWGKYVWNGDELVYEE